MATHDDNSIEPTVLSDAVPVLERSSVRIPILKRLITDCDRLAADLDQEVRNEEDRVRIHDPAHCAYPTYAKATASRRDNLRRSADGLRAHLGKAEQALRELGEALDA